MPTLFISYKRGTAAVAPLIEKLKAAHYRLWFDRDEIHLGDPDWQARINQGLQRCDGVLLNITPAACQSEPVRYEVKKARELGKPIFPIILERITDYDAAIRDLGLSEKQHIEDFTDVTRWNEQVQRLLRDLESQGLRVTHHERRQQRDPNNPNYVLHQTYLKRLAERIGMLNLAQINPENTQGVELERVYVDSPTGLSLSVEMRDWQVADWWISVNDEDEPLGPFIDVFRDGGTEAQASYRPKPQKLGYEDAPFEALVNRLDAEITVYREKNPDAKLDERYFQNAHWSNGVKKNQINIHLNHLAAARDRLVVLGAPGSGKSTFVKYLALCLAGSGIDEWTRDASIAALDNWTHGTLTPVYIELRRFVASKYFPIDLKTLPTADHLWAYIQHEILGAELSAYADDLRYDLEHGHAVLILDGLDEVPYPEGKLKQRQQQLISLAQSLNTRYATSRIIVASRPYAYEGWTLPGFQSVTITEFEDDHRIVLASRLYRATGLDENAAQKKAQVLNGQLKYIDDELKDRPLFVTLMATIYLKGDTEGLPTRRGALYRESILLLLDRWTQSKLGAPSLVEILGDKSLNDLYARLAALAYDVHERYGEQRGTPEIDESLLYQHLKPLGRSIAAELIPYLSENAGVLVSPGQDAEKDVFHFAHRTFQEYMSAVHLVTVCAEMDSFRQIRDLIMSNPQVWRVPCVLAGDVLADTNRRGDLWDMLDDVLDDEIPKDMAADDPRWWAVWLSGVILQEQRLFESDKLRRSEKAVAELLRDGLVALIETPQALEPTDRAVCGRALSLLGDPRLGIGILIKTSVKLPDIAWCEVPGGKFKYGGDPNPATAGQYRRERRDAYKGSGPDPLDSGKIVEIDLPTFYIARYPVTYVQFQSFIDDAEGFHNPHWWDGLGQEDIDYRYRNQRRPDDPKVKYANHPRGNVSWYDAIAFCRWLSWRLGGGYFLHRIAEWAVRLPTDYEWEKAARGTDERIYPYGNDFDAARDNTSATGIGQSSAVGIFPNGASPYGVLDMSGNIAEWCLTNRDVCMLEAAQEDMSFAGPRMYRTVSWESSRDDSRTVSRTFGNMPFNRFDTLGFRLVCARPSMQ